MNKNLPPLFRTDLKQCQTKPEIRSFHEKRNLYFEKKTSKVSVLQLCSFIPVQRTQITHTTQFETDLQHFQTKYRIQILIKIVVRFCPKTRSKTKVWQVQCLFRGHRTWNRQEPLFQTELDTSHKFSNLKIPNFHFVSNCEFSKFTTEQAEIWGPDTFYWGSLNLSSSKTQ